MAQIDESKLDLIVPPPTDVEEAIIRLDTSIDKCVTAIRDIKRATKLLNSKLEHPFQLEAVAEIDNLVAEALIPYLAEVDIQFKNIVAP